LGHCGAEPSQGKRHHFIFYNFTTTKLAITIDGETKEFHSKTKSKQYLSTNPALQRIIEKVQHKVGNCTQEKTKKIILSQQTQKKRNTET